MSRRRVLIVHPYLHPAGGSEAVGAWMIDALQDSFDVTLLTWSRPDFDALNRWYGTLIRASDVSVHVVPAAMRRIVDAAPVWLGLLRYALVTRAARREASGYDLVICADNEAVFGRPIIQYIHYPRFLRPRPRGDVRWYHRVPGALKAYYTACAWLVPGTAEEMARNVTLVNSSWTADRTRALYPTADIRVVYPPVTTDFPDVPWDAREPGFFCLGRFASQKETAKVIDILAAVRRVVPEIRLHLAGARTSRAAFRHLARLVRPHQSWIQVHDNLSRIQLSALIARQRYGIHGMPEEHFGIGPAEMVRAGCIVFLPDGGGQVEIVSRDDRLLYRTHEEAVAKIVRVLTDADEQTSLRRTLARSAGAFSVEQFVRSIREVADRCLVDRQPQALP